MRYVNMKMFEANTKQSKINVRILFHNYSGVFNKINIVTIQLCGHIAQWSEYSHYL